MNAIYKYFLALVLLCGSLDLSAQNSPEYALSVKARVANSEKKTFSEWKDYETRSLTTLNGFKSSHIVPLSKYGGRKDKKTTAIGFFYVKKIDGRWWAVDPEGNLFINIGLVNVSTGGSDRNRELLNKKFGNKKKWAEGTHRVLLDNGFNSLGAWSDNDAFKANKLQIQNPLTYTIIKNFMSDYGKIRGGVYQESGHMAYPDRTMFVFDPQFEAFCDTYARQLAANKNDRNLFGYFSDNELPFERLSLDRYLNKSDKKDPGFLAAQKWMSDQNLNNKAITDAVRNEFIGFMAEKYYSVVSKAIKKYDPNHMYLGSRLHHSYELKVKQLFEVAGKYVDLIAINYYRHWTPVQQNMENWSSWSGKPFFVTEWYVKGADSGMPNYSGAGWEVKTQEDRGLFYQNFTLGLLESKNCVGFQWFKYQDNDPTNMKSDPSNRDSNKGIVNNHYELYQPLIQKMKALNQYVYPLIDFFDARN